MLSEPRYPFTDQLPTVEAVQVGQWGADPGTWRFDSTGGGGTLLVNPLERVASWTDEQLEPRQWIPVPTSLRIDPDVLPWQRPQWAVDADLTTIAVFEIDELSIHDASGIRFRRPHPPGWDPVSNRPRLSGVFINRHLWCVVTENSPDRHRLVVIDCERWEEVLSAELHSRSPEGFSVWAHPSSEGVVVAAGRGQEGTDIWTFRRDGDGPALRRLDRDDQVFGEVCFDDGSLLMLPHAGETLSVYAWPDLDVIAHVSNSDVFSLPRDAGGDAFGWCGFPVEGGVLLVMTVRGRLVLVDRDRKEPIAEVRIPGYGWMSSSSPAGRHHDPDLFAIRKVAGRRFVADHDRRFDDKIWEIPRERPVL